MVFNPTNKVFGAGVITLTDGDARVFDTRGMSRVSIITGVGAVVTVSRVDLPEAEEHSEGETNAFQVTASTLEVWDADWPFYLVSVAGGSARVTVL